SSCSLRSVARFSRSSQVREVLLDSRCSSRAPAGVRSRSISAAVRAAGAAGSAGSAGGLGLCVPFSTPGCPGPAIVLSPRQSARRIIANGEIRKAEKIDRFSRMPGAGMRNLAVCLLVGFRVTLFARLFADSFQQTLEQKPKPGRVKRASRSDSTSLFLDNDLQE